MAREPGDKSGGGIMIPFAVVTLIGGVGGSMMGAQLLPGTFAPSTGSSAVPASPVGEPGAHTAADGKAKSHEGSPREKLEVRELPPVVTNLSGGGRKRAIRLQSAIVYDPHELRHVDSVVASLMSDVTAFLSTVDLSSIEGPDGLRRLQEELADRAATRSEHRIREFVIEGLVVQ